MDINTVVIVVLIFLNLITIFLVWKFNKMIDTFALGMQEILAKTAHHADMDALQHGEIREQVRTVLARQDEHGKILAAIQAKAGG